MFFLFSLLLFSRSPLFTFHQKGSEIEEGSFTIISFLKGRERERGREGD